MHGWTRRLNPGLPVPWASALSNELLTPLQNHAAHSVNLNPLQVPLGVLFGIHGLYYFILAKVIVTMVTVKYNYQ